jgi:hypothetical protein
MEEPGAKAPGFRVSGADGTRRRRNYEGFGAFRLSSTSEFKRLSTARDLSSKPRSVSTSLGESKKARERLAADLRRLADEWKEGLLLEDNLRKALLRILLKLA